MSDLGSRIDRSAAARNWYLIVGAGAMLVPVVLALFVLPTAMIDTRELLAWGRFLPLATPKHPPMMALVGGVMETVLPPTAFWSILVGQCLNAVGVVYLYATLRMVVGREQALLFAFLFATSFYFLLAPLYYALNADILQVPIWLGVVYHFIRAARTDRIGHWLAVAIWSAAAVLTKYSAGILFLSGGAASLIVPDYRRVWRNPRLYAAALVGAALLIPHLLALGDNWLALEYAARLSAPDADLAARLTRILPFIPGVAVFLAPGWIIVGIGFFNRNCALRRQGEAHRQTAASRRFLIVLALLAVISSLAVVLAAGTTFKPRFAAPLLGPIWMAIAVVVAVDPTPLRAGARRVAILVGAISAAVLIATAVAFGIFTGHVNMQEPTERAAAVLRAEWNETFSCGPAYYLGDRPSAHGLALAGDRKPIGVPLDDMPLVRWYDPDLLKREGAIVVSAQPIPATEIAAHFPDIAIGPERTITLPLVRTLSGRTTSYHYLFVPPQSCAIGTPLE